MAVLRKSTTRSKCSAARPATQGIVFPKDWILSKTWTQEMSGFPLNNVRAFGPTTTENFVCGKSLSRISITGNVKITSPMLLKEMTRILLILDLSNRMDDFVYADRLHAGIIGTFPIVTWSAVAPHIVLQNDRPAAPARPCDLGTRRTENSNDTASHAAGDVQRPRICRHNTIGAFHKRRQLF